MDRLMLAYSKSANRLKFLYALPAFVLAFPTIPVFVLLPTFYAETLGLGLATVGFAMLVLRLLDVISDPILGWLTDRIPERFGKRKLPIALGALIAGPALIALFSPPEFVGVGYLLLFGSLLYLGWTAVQIPYLAWAVDLSSDYQERNKINGLREAMGLIGILSVGGIGLFFADMEELPRLSATAWLTVAVGVLLITPALKFVPEKRSSGLRPKFAFPYRNKLFLRVLSAWFLNGLANGLPAVCLPLYLTHVLQSNSLDKALLLFVYFLYAVLGIPVWLWLSKSIDKHRVWCLSMLMACVVFLLVPFLGEGDILAFGFVCALTGFALGSDLSLPPSIQGDCADWDRLRFGYERTATLFSYWSMSTKMALGLAVGIAFPVLGFYGLSEETIDAQSDGKIALIVIYAALPIVLKIAAVTLMWNFPLGKTSQKSIKRALERRT